jgi:hypothetical protein
MKLSKTGMSIALAIAGAGFINTALANHFTVGGSENGNFTITGVLWFVDSSGSRYTTETFAPGTQDLDEPTDVGLPVTTGYISNGEFTQYSCPVTMNGSVVNGVASVTSMSVNKSTTYCRLLVLTNLPWRLHTISGAYPALLEGVGFMRAGTATCTGVSAWIATASGSMGVYDDNSPGCYIWTNMALTVTPALEIVSN